MNQFSKMRTRFCCCCCWYEQQDASSCQWEIFHSLLSLSLSFLLSLSLSFLLSFSFHSFLLSSFNLCANICSQFVLILWIVPTSTCFFLIHFFLLFSSLSSSSLINECLRFKSMNLHSSFCSFLNTISWETQKDLLFSPISNCSSCSQDILSLGVWAERERKKKKKREREIK